jgi:hypothetical protein
MSILKTKPENSIPTKHGWVDPKTGDLLVSIYDLVGKMEQELVVIEQRIAFLEQQSQLPNN